MKCIRSQALFLLVTLSPSTFAKDFTEYLDQFLTDIPNESINPLFQQGIAVQRRALNRERKIIVAFAPGFDFNFGAWAHVPIGLQLGYSLSEKFEASFHWVPKFYGIQKATSRQLKDLTFEDGESPDLTQSKKSREYGLLLHWAPGYGKMSFSMDRAYRYDFFFDLLLGYTQFVSAASPKVGFGVGSSLIFSDRFSLRYSFMATLLSTPDLESGKSSAGMVGEFAISTVFYL